MSNDRRGSKSSGNTHKPDSDTQFTVTDTMGVKRNSFEKSQGGVSVFGKKGSSLEHMEDSDSILGGGLIAHSESFTREGGNRAKYASAHSFIRSDAGGLSQGQADTLRLAPEVYSPLYQIANLHLPRDRRTMNAWNRAFYETNPIVRNSINLHATYPISKIRLKCPDKKVLQFFEDMCEEINLTEVIQNVALEFWKMGEVFPFARFNENTRKWDKVIVHNPDYVHVQRSVDASEPIIWLQPDETLKQIVDGKTHAHSHIKNQLPPEIIRLVKQNKNIPLDDFNISHLRHLSSPYSGRGISLIASIYKDLMLYDKLRESKFAQADSLVNPITLVRLGDMDQNRPSPQDLEAFRQIMEEAQYDKDFKIVTHAAVNIDRIGSSGSIMEISSDMDFIVKNILTGLMTPDSIINTEGPTYASASIGLEVLRGRYANFRNQLENWIIRKLFRPIAQEHKFYDYKDKEKRLIYPTISWNKMNLRDVNDYITNIKELAMQPLFDGEGAETFIGRLSVGSVLDSLDIDFQEDIQRRRYEMIQYEILKQERKAIGTMTLTELRSLDPEKEIPDNIVKEKTTLMDFKGLGTQEKGPGEELGGPGGEEGGLGGLPPMPSGGGGGGPPPESPAPEGGGGEVPPTGGEMPPDLLPSE